MTTTEKWTESRIFELLRKRFPSPAFVLLPQVRNTTGDISHAVRTVDALAISTWPSRGLWIAGIEIKCYYGDWRRELKNPAKAEAIQKYCRYWYVAAPKGLIPVAEIPDNWGLIECTEGASRIPKTAPMLKETPVDMEFVAAILRRACEVMQTPEQVEQAVKECREKASVQWERASEAVRKLEDLESLAGAVETFEEASGVDLRNVKWEAGNIGKAVKIVRDSGVLKCVKMASRLRNQTQKIVEQLDETLATIAEADEAALHAGDTS